jgi:hypothetical protein
MHQSMALEDLGHEVHFYNLNKHPLSLTDYVQSFEFDLIFVDLELLRSQPLLRILMRFRKSTPVKLVGALYRLPAPPDAAWEIADFTVTPWKGASIAARSLKFDVRYLPLAYNDRLHRRKTGSHELPGLFVGNSSGERQEEADVYLAQLIEDRSVLGIGPGFAEKYVDPFALGSFYASARCLPNFHYSWEKAADCILNERFWQTARCGIPVNDHSPLMEEVFDRELLENFCFADARRWKERVRGLSSGTDIPNPSLLQKLHSALTGHSYHNRMGQLLEWLT